MAGLYIHIPFCIHKCDYCDFVSFVCDDTVKKAYVDSLIDEIRLSSELYGDRTINTVFIGGGTPSCLHSGEIFRIAEAVVKGFTISPDAEFTVECNPGTVTLTKLEEYKQSGVNRLSFGLQSTDSSLLKGISRIHTFEDFSESLHMAREVGFNNINADIMYALPGQTVSLLADTLEKICELNLTHISAYALILEEHTKLHDDILSGRKTLPSEDEEYAMHSAVINTLKANGYKRYEISNYAMPGFECKHNLCYWDCDEYIGLGLNSHSALWIDGKWTRYCNYSELKRYRDAVSQGKLPISDSEKISISDAMYEFIMVGLRKTDGIRLSDFSGRFGVNLKTVYGEKISELSEYLVLTENRLFLNDKGLDMQNYVLCELL